MMAFAREGLLTPFGTLVVFITIHWHNELCHLKVPLEWSRIAHKDMRTH